MRGGSDLVVRYPRTAVTVSLVATLLLGLAARHVRIEASMSSILRADHPGVQFYDDVRIQGKLIGVIRKLD